MNERSPYRSRALPLFGAEPEVWIGLDKSTQAQVLDCLGWLLLRHLQQTPGCILQEQTLMKGTRE
jgi:hypothetical protein